MFYVALSLADEHFSKWRSALRLVRTVQKTYILCLAPYGPTRNTLVRCGHFDTGYANLRQVTYLSARLMEKSRLAFK